jgi:phospholipase A1
MTPIPRGQCFLSMVLLILAWLVSPASAEEKAESFQLIQTEPGLSLHKEMFMLPATWSDAYNGRRTEAVFQLSAKHRLFGTRFYFAYTQISFWQAYDYNNSSPFRETDYNPELFYRFRPISFRSGYLGADAGFEHESNGQLPPISRSWNLFYVSPSYHRANVLLYVKFRYRIPEEKKPYPGAAVGDDNPDILDFMGYSDVHLFVRFLKTHQIHLMLRGNLDTGKGGLSFNYSLPVPKSDQSFLCLRFTHGYGESLVDYKKSINRVGVGIMFAR